MKASVRKIKRSHARRAPLSFPAMVPVYLLKSRSVNPLFHLAHYSLFSRFARIKPSGN